VYRDKIVVLNSLMQKLGSSIGNWSTDLGIPECSFCKKCACHECAFGVVFGRCNGDGSHWRNMKEKLNKVDGIIAREESKLGRW